MVENLNTVSRGRDVYIWGAAGKDCIFLAHCRRLSKVIERVRFAVDSDPSKHDKFFLSSGVKIEATESFFSVVQPGALVIVANPMYQIEIEAEIKACVPGELEGVVLG